MKTTSDELPPGALTQAALAEAQAEDHLYSIVQRIDALATKRLDDAQAGIRKACARLLRRIEMSLVVAAAEIAATAAAVRVTIESADVELARMDRFTGDDHGAPVLTAEEWDAETQRQRNAPWGRGVFADHQPLAISPRRTPAPNIAPLTEEEIDEIESADTVVMLPAELAACTQNCDHGPGSPDGWADARQLDAEGIQ
jgi:histone H3/H4